MLCVGGVEMGGDDAREACPRSSAPVGAPRDDGTNTCVGWESGSAGVVLKAVVPFSDDPLSAVPHSAQKRLRPLLRAPQTGQLRAEVARAEVMEQILIEQA